MLAILFVMTVPRTDRNVSAGIPIEKTTTVARSVAAPVSASGTVSGASRVTKVGVIRRKDPEVLVPAHEARALRDLFAAVRDGRVDLSPLVEDPSYTMVETHLGEETLIPPVSVEQVPAMTNLEGARQ